MQLTHSQITRLAELNVQLFTCKQQITELKKLMHQLLQQDCKISVNITVSNLSLLESEMPIIDDIEARLCNALGFSGQRISQPRKQSMFYNPDASTGIRILNAILQERQEIKTDILEEMESIISQNIRIEIEEQIINPIQNLHS